MSVDKIKTDFNVEPYFDDYFADYQNNEDIIPENRNTVEDKQYVRILFKPSTAVQARELTQIQTMIQKQISRQGDYFFRDGAVVDGCDVVYYSDLDYIRCDNAITAVNTETFPSPTLADIRNDYVIASFYEGIEVGTRAVPLFTRSGSEEEYPATNRVYLRYITEGELTSDDLGSPTSNLIGFKEKFFSGEVLRVYNENQDKTGTLDANNLLFELTVYTPEDETQRADGVAYAIKVGDGIIYQKGYFLRTLEQIIPVNEFTRNVDGLAVGYNTEESIITFLEDGTLVSNARGFPNENAPGADRFKLSPTLVSKRRDDFTEYKDFFPVVEFSGQQPFQQNTGEEGLRRIRDLMAVRTNEESGDYSVRPFKIEPIPFATAFPQDAEALAIPEIPRKNFAYDISPGTIYCRGYRVDTINNYKLLSRKGLDKKIDNELALSANYGNYVIVNEVLGTFDIDRLSTVDLYDTYQNAISTYNGSDIVPDINSKIGTAKVRAFNYLKGTKGLPDCQYVLYLFDIKMTSSSFDNVKSIKSNAGDDPNNIAGDAIADIFRRDGENVTILRSPSLKSLVFETGFRGIDTFKPNDNNENQFLFYDILDSEISDTSKIADFTLNAPYAGGTEVVNGLVNTLEGSFTNFFLLSLSEAAETVNLNNTIDATETGLTLSTANSNNLENIKIGDQINIKSGANEVKRVVTGININGSTISINESLSGSSVASDSAANFSIYYPQGHHVNIVDVNDAIENIAPNLATQARQFRVNTDLGGSLNLVGNVNVRASIPVRRTSATETKKEIQKNVFVKIDCAGVNGNTNEIGPWNLGITDLARIRSIHVGSTFSEDNPERTAWFEINNGQKDAFYDYAFLRVRPQYTSNISASTKILIKLDYFTDNKASGIGFYNVDSYPIDDNQESATTIYTEEIPNYYSEIKRKRISLRNSIDFRPKKFNLLTPNSDENSAPVILTPNTTELNWKTSEAALTVLTPEDVLTDGEEFDVGSAGQYLIAPNTNFGFDLERYLPRIDYLCVNFKGQFEVVEGESNDNPIEPPNPKNLSVIASSYVPPFPSLTPREKQTYGTPETEVITLNNKMIKRYTMRDIASIEDRIDRLEYYTTLNLLEQEAKELTVLDENGLDRFKNGIFADGFKSHFLGQIDDVEYNIAIDDRIGVARPKFETNAGDFDFVDVDGSSVTKVGRYLMLPYTDVEFISQDYATKTRNSAAISYDYSGTLKLFPESDFFKDTTREPVKNTVLDFAQPFVDFVNGFGGTLYGEWEVVNVNKKSEIVRASERTLKAEDKYQLNINTVQDVPNNLTRFLNNTQDTTQTSNTTPSIEIDVQNTLAKFFTITRSKRDVFNYNVETSTNRQVVGDNVTDVSVISYMRSREIFFVAYGLKPNTRHYAFFENVPVSSDCKPCAPIAQSQFNSLDPKSLPNEATPLEELSDVISISSENASSRASSTSQANLIQATGNFGDQLRTNDSGVLAGIFRIPEGQFLNGERKLLITNVDDLAIGKDSQISQAKAAYNSSGISVTKQKQTLTSYEPDISVAQSIERKKDVDVDRVKSSKITDVRVDMPSQTVEIKTPGAPERPINRDDGWGAIGPDDGAGIDNNPI